MDSEVEKIGILNDSFQHWKTTPLPQRLHLLSPLKNHLLTNKEKLTTLMAKEMNKPIKEGLPEIEKCAGLIDYYSAHSETLLTPNQLSPTEKISYDPLGIILGIMPWNFPFWQVFRFVIPTLISGNVVTVKHASNVSGCLSAIQNLFDQLNLDSPIFESIYLPGNRVGELISHPLIKGVSITGSELAGRDVGSKAGHALKPSVLELGGSDPFIISEHCALEKTVNGALTARFKNCGQVCISAKRFLIHESIFERFITLLKTKLTQLNIGDPLNPNTEMGPMAKQDLVDTLHKQVKRSEKESTPLYQRQNLPEGPLYFPPTLIQVKDKNSTLWQEETFGPVAAFMTYKTKEEALDLANDSHFGLGASVWTDNEEEKKIFSTQLEAGSVFINQPVTSHYHLPFGGIKNSGFGRELGEYGLKSFCNIKTVVG